MASIIYDNDQQDQSARPDAYGYAEEGPPVALGPILRQAMAIGRRNLWLILAIIATFLMAAATMTLLQTPKYTAVASMEIANRSDEILGDQFDTTSQESVPNPDTQLFLNTQIGVLSSRSLVERVAQELNLYSDPRFFAAMQVDKDDFPTDSDRQNAVIDLITKNYSATLSEFTRIAQVRFTSADPRMSAQIANAFATEFIQANLQRRFDSSSYARSFVQQQLDQARARLEQSEQDLNNYARQAGLIRTRDPSSTDASSPTSSGGSVTSSSLMQVNQAANDAQAKLVAAQAQWDAERLQPLLSSPAALSSPVVQALLNKRSDLQAQLDAARNRYRDDHPTVQRLTNDLKSTDQQVNSAANEARNTVRANLVAAQTAAHELRSAVRGLEKATLEEQDRSVRYNTLAREADTNRSIYDGLLQRFRELNASAGITTSNVSITDPAVAPTKPSSPNPMLNMAIALVLGIVVAAIVVVVKDQLDDRIRIPEEVEQKVGVSLLGVVPDVKDVDPIVALTDPKSVISESYGALRSSLLYSTRDGLPQVVLVTSAQASEGKSTTSFAVARSMAQVGKRTLLVDGDLRRPSIQRLAGVAKTVGLSSVLVGESSIAEAIAHDETDNLFIMPSGPLPPSPAELLSSPRLIETLNAVRKEFDFILVDSPPVLGLADSPGLSALADGVLLVIEADRGRGGQLKAAVRRLRMMKPTILGAVLTKFDPNAAGNTYSTYYRYDYSQSHSSVDAASA